MPTTTGDFSSAGAKPVTGANYVGKTKEERAELAKKNMAAGAASEVKPTVKNQMQAYADRNQANIGGIYDSGAEAQKQALLNAYNANVEAQQGAAQTVRDTGGVLSNDIGVQNARNMANINQFADVRGVNRQQGSQAALQLGNAGNAAMANMAYRQQQALAENQRQQELAKVQYQAQVQAALADNDYKRAAALLDDYKNNQKWQDQQAAILASYGNFDPYKQMYGNDAGTAMQKVWQAQNPEVAYRTGAISAEQYRQLTGNYPAGYNPGGGGGGLGWYPGVGDPGDGDLGGPGSGKGGPTPSLFGVNNASVIAPVLTPTAINAAERYK